jgi:hypothetical protein
MSSLQTSRPHPPRTKKWGHVKEGPCVDGKMGALPLLLPHTRSHTRRHDTRAGVAAGGRDGVFVFVFVFGARGLVFITCCSRYAHVRLAQAIMQPPPPLPVALPFAHVFVVWRYPCTRPAARSEGPEAEILATVRPLGPWVQGGAGMGWVCSGGPTWPRGRLGGSVAGDPDRHRGWLLCPSSVPAAAGRVGICANKPTTTYGLIGTIG